METPESPETPDQAGSDTEDQTPERGPYPHNPDIPGPEDGEDNGDEDNEQE